MFAWLRDLITLRKRFEELQKAHDLRQGLNRRLHLKNQELAKLCGRIKPKEPSKGQQRHIAEMSAKMAERKAMQHITVQRYEIQIRMMRKLVSYEQANAIEDEVRSMTDEQVLAYRKPKTGE